MKYSLHTFNLFIIPLILLISHGAQAESNSDTTFTQAMDRLERQLEMGRHEQLINLKAQPDSGLADFHTDGCSGGLSVGWEYLADRIEYFQEIHGQQPPWQSCCITHDRAYHTGGPRRTTAAESFAARKNADLSLKACVQETGRQRSPELMAAYKLTAPELKQLYTTIASLMYRAVRIGGMPCTGLPWRWGYGWPECR